MLSLIEFCVSWRESLNYKGYGTGGTSSERQMAEAAGEMAPFDSRRRPDRRKGAAGTPALGIVRHAVIGRDL
jgi:hypothetical protein